MNSNKTYVSHSCNNKKCFRAFMAKDSIDSFSKPPSWKVCPECRKNGFKDDKKLKEIERYNESIDRTLYEYFGKENAIKLTERQSKILEDVILKKKNNGVKFRLSSCIKEALEIDSYYEDDRID